MDSVSASNEKVVCNSKPKKSLIGLQDSCQDRLVLFNVHMYDEFHVPDVLIVLLYMWRFNSQEYWFKQNQPYKLSISDFPKLYPATLSISMLCIIFARFACCCCLSQKFWKDSITTTLPLLIACFQATILIVLSFTHGATIKAKLWLEESQTWREHLPENGSWILIG